MPEIISCPDCGRKLRVTDDLMGRAVKCPSCSTQFTAEPGRSPAPPPPREDRSPRLAHDDDSRRPSSRDDDDYGRPRRYRNDDDDHDRRRRYLDEDDDYDRRRRYRDDDDYDRPARRLRDEYDFDPSDPDAARAAFDSWRKVRTGLTFVIASIWVVVGGIVLFCMSGVFLTGMTINSLTRRSAMGLSSSGNGFHALVFFGYLIGLASMGLKVTGHALGMAVPPRKDSSVRGLAVTTLVLVGVNVALSLLGNVLNVLTDVDAVANGFFPTALLANNATGVPGVFASLFGIAALFVFLVYLRSVAIAVRQRGVAGSVTAFIIVSGICFGLLFLSLIAMGVDAEELVQGRISRPNYTRSFVGANFEGALCLSPFVALGMFIWYIVLLHQVRGGVDRYLRRM